MIGQQTLDVERKITAILTILSESIQPAGSRWISRLLKEQGIYLSERAVRYHLKIMDERGLTRSTGNKDGRVITKAGLDEMHDTLVIDKLGFISTKIERLACQTKFGLRLTTSKIPVDVSLFNNADFPDALKIMSSVFEAGLCSSELVALGGEGARMGQAIVPAGKMGLATVCSVALCGCLLNVSIPSHARFGGLLQIKDREPYRFVDLIEFSGSTIDPAEIFVSGRMTEVKKAALDGGGKVLAAYHEIPLMSLAKAEEVLRRLQHQGLICPVIVARPGQKICEIPYNPDRVGLIALNGLNPTAAALESGIDAQYKPMCGMMDFSMLRPFKELL